MLGGVRISRLPPRGIIQPVNRPGGDKRRRVLATGTIAATALVIVLPFTLAGLSPTALNVSGYAIALAAMAPNAITLIRWGYARHDEQDGEGTGAGKAGQAAGRPAADGMTARRPESAAPVTLVVGHTRQPPPAQAARHGGQVLSDGIAERPGAPRPGRLWLLLTGRPAQVTGAALAVVILVILASTNIPGPPVPGSTTRSVPYVQGLTQQAAASDLRKVGLGYHVGSVNSGAPHGQVVSQSPPGGTKVRTGTIVTLGVSNSQEVSVPDVYGMTVQQATAALHRAGFRVSVTGSAYSLGVVVSWSPGEEAPAGSTIFLTIGYIG
jgi:eukaryotic-like serine/threonine-protein kinase